MNQLHKHPRNTQTICVEYAWLIARDREGRPRDYLAISPTGSTVWSGYPSALRMSRRLDADLLIKSMPYPGKFTAERFAFGPPEEMVRK